MNIDQPITIILVEDNEGHARLVEKNLRRAGITNVIISFDNGQSAVDYLQKISEDEGESVNPFLMLLDLNLPVLDGYEVLKRLKGSSATRQIPVIVFTSTDNPHEIERCYELGCNLYITKPVEHEGFSEAVKKLGMLLDIVKIP